MKLGILWDLDGTLLNTLEDLRDAVNYALGVHGCPERTLEEVRRFVGNGAERLIRLALPGLPGDPVAEDVLRTFRDYYDTHCRVKTRPYDGIMEALTLLGKEYPMAVVSNKPDSAVKALCRMYFPGVYAQGEGAACLRKPAPDMVWQAMSVLGVEKCLYVGDSEVDVATAKNAGVPCLSVLWGFRDVQTLREAGAEHFCGRPSDLPAVIRALEGSYGK